MTLEWISDCCFCVFHVKDDFSAIEKIIEKCKLHNEICDDDILLKTVQSFNNSYNDKLSTTSTKEEVLASMKEKYDKKMTTKNDIC